MTATELETPLWWVMVIMGVTAALLSIATNSLDRRKGDWPTTKQRFLMHLASYGFLTVSILAFVLRGLLTPV